MGPPFVMSVWLFNRLAQKSLWVHRARAREGGGGEACRYKIMSPLLSPCEILSRGSRSLVAIRNRLRCPWLDAVVVDDQCARRLSTVLGCKGGSGFHRFDRLRFSGSTSRSMSRGSTPQAQHHRQSSIGSIRRSPVSHRWMIVLCRSSFSARSRCVSSAPSRTSRSFLASRM
jgi:hypothetical protein